MKILSIDVGIKNLAYCLLDIDKIDIDKSNEHFKILKWDTINLLEQKKCIECVILVFVSFLITIK